MTDGAVELEVALLSAEADYIAELVDRGILPAGARREPTARELRAGVRFAELDRLVVQAAALIMRDINPYRDELIDTIAADLPRATAYGTVEALIRWNSDNGPDVAAVHAAIAGQLEGLAQSGADEALGEAARQGFPTSRLPSVDAVTDEVRAAAAAHAARITATVADRVLGPAVEAAQRAATLPGATSSSVADSAITAARAASVAQVEDVARQAANVTHGLGRHDAQAAMPEPAEVYASELLDRSTCEPCASIDGTEYSTLEEGFADYPGAGGYIACDGGSRCRGTLVIVWPQEASPTTRQPGFGPSGGQLPR